jgi:hypothetical protein
VDKSKLRRAVLASLPVGAIVGVAYGFASTKAHLRFLLWLWLWPDESAVWAVVGAAAAGGAVYVWGLLQSK